MNGLQITGLVLIGACVVSILAAVFRGDGISLFVAALVLGIAGNILYWLGKPHYAEDEEKPEEPSKNENGPQNQPPAS